VAGRSRSAIRGRQRRIFSFFDTHRHQVFQQADLGRILRDHRDELDLPQTFNTNNLIALLTDTSDGGKLRRIEIRSEREDLARDHGVTRYVWGEATPYSVALSLRGGAYLTHASACYLHGITEQIPHTIYINKEQSPKPQGEDLTQASIDRAFSNQARVSNYTFRYQDYRIIILSGKNTGRLEVSSLEIRPGEWVDVTKLERTLIDITVRPVYAGGVSEVLNSYMVAKSRASISTLIATYRKLEYVYPYHQAIGFYMERAGFPESALERIRKLGSEYNFYLDYKMSKPKFDSTWRIYYPDSL
jgi:predicted transcriptional regulator of viral defense system